ncbi:unnamed protein product [Rhizophagus irregularis]|nr:unnamed protein product [Rhizophagus irregularis]CAB4408883.1 unnamed protein product [Rhizophagus irregularis]
MRNLRSKRKVSDQQNIEAIIDGFETDTNSISNVPSHPLQKLHLTTLSDNDLYPFASKVTSITTSANDDIFINSLLKSSPNELETQVPIIIENENSDSHRLTLKIRIKFLLVTLLIKVLMVLKAK